MTDCLFCDAKNVDTDHHLFCHDSLASQLASDARLFGIKCTERIQDDEGNLIGVRRVDPIRLKFNVADRRYTIHPPTRSPYFMVTESWRKPRVRLVYPQGTERAEL